MQRVMIIGQPGSGKSTLARNLGLRTGLPVVHIDTIHWQPGWIERSRDEKTRLCYEVEARDCWIFEGGHSVTWENRMARADLLIWIDRSAPLRFWRVLLRTLLQRGRSRPDLPENCPELLANLPEFSWRLHHQHAALFICALTGIPMPFSRALDIRLIELYEIDRRLIDWVRTLPTVSGCFWP